MEKRILIAEPAHVYLKESLDAYGFICEEHFGWTRNEILDRISDYFGLIVRTKTRVDQQLIEKAVNLKFVGRLGAGMEHIDLTACAQKGIICLSSPEGNRNAVAEYVVGSLIGLIHKIIPSHIASSQLEWTMAENTGIELEGLSIGIIGYGFMGRAVARKFKAMGCRILATDKYLKGFAEPGIVEVSLEGVFKTGRCGEFAYSIQPGNHYFADINFFRSFDKPIYIINTARGGVLNTKHLIQALNENLVRGAVLDVFENEPFNQINPNDQISKNSLMEFFNRSNVVVTPHIAGVTKDAYYKLAAVLSQKIQELF